MMAVREGHVPMPFDRRHANTVGDEYSRWTAQTEQAICGLNCVSCVKAVQEVHVPMAFDRRHAYMYTAADCSRQQKPSEM